MLSVFEHIVEWNVCLFENACELAYLLMSRIIDFI